MRLQNVDGVESDPIAILLVQSVQGRNLPPERRSGIASKNKYNRLPPAER
jgi:hypothetical protein